MKLSLLQCSKFARASYAKPHEVIDAYNRCGQDYLTDCISPVTELPTFLFDVITDSQIYCFTVKNELYVAIRGTNSLVDSFYDLSTEPIKTDIGLLHEGFTKQANAVELLLKDVLTIFEGTEIVFIGHSAGGAVAAIVAARTNFPIISYRGFGVPKFGDDTFKIAFTSKIKDATFVKNGRDPVTKIIAGYVAVAELVLYGRFDPFPEIPVFFDAIDHHIANYVTSIEGTIKPRNANPWDEILRFFVGFFQLSNSSLTFASEA